jgi:hypothetical protein
LNDIADIASRFNTLTDHDSNLFNEWKERVNRFQKSFNPVFKAFHGFDYLPIQAFKEKPICCFDPEEAERIFLSSGTGKLRSRHFVRYLEMYERAILTGFKRVFGPGPFIFLAHLPAYKSDSSLVYMADVLIRELGAEGSGFFLDDVSVLKNGIRSSKQSGHPLILLGAAFGLMDLLEQRTFELPPDSIDIETGGMKTHRREISRNDLHKRLSEGFGLPASHIRSEYGMCELLSQCYTNEEGLFEAPPWVRIEVLDTKDFKTPMKVGEAGALAIFDMANLYSQSAILTQDIAIRHEGGFEILGRMEQAEIRGCNLLLET